MHYHLQVSWRWLVCVWRAQPQSEKGSHTRMAIADKYGIPVVEDAAEGMGSYFEGKVLALSASMAFCLLTVIR